MSNINRSYFYKCFKSSIIILIVPLLTTLLIFLQAQSIVKEQILTASNNTLNQFFKRIDAVVKESQEICITMGNNSVSRLYATYAASQPERTGYQGWELYNQLSNYYGEKYFDIFIYYPSIDQIVSGAYASMKADAYYDTFYKTEGNDYKEEFREILNCTSGKPVLCSMNSSSLDSYLCVAMRQSNYGDEKYNYVVVTVLNPIYVSELIQEANGAEQGGITMVFNSSKEQLLSSDEIGFDYRTLTEAWDTSPIEQRIDGQAYIMHVQKADSVKAYYAYAAPYSYFWSKLNKLYIICGIGGLVSILLGILISWRESRKIYQPIGQMVSNLQEELEYDAKQNTEFEFIEALFAKGKEEKVVLNRAVRSGQEAKKSIFLKSLLEGNTEMKASETDAFKTNGVTLCSDLFQVCLLYVEEGGPLDEKEMTFVMINVYEELCNKSHKGYMVRLQADRFAILLNLDANVNSQEADFLSVLEEGRTFLEKYYHITATFGISSVQEGMLGIHTAYEEALQALKYRYLLGKESMIAYQQIKNRSFQYLPPSDSRMLHMITGFLSNNGKDGGTIGLVQEIMNDYGISKDISLETMECFKTETFSVLNRVLMQEGLWGESWKKMLKELLTRSTLEEFQESFAEMLEKLYCKCQEIVENEDVCKKALDYIDENFADSQLSLKYLSEILDISPSYLSKLFKEKYQISIPDYVMQARVNCARTELKETTRSIQEIAVRNGFVSDNSFIKAFKKIEGITPGVYRNILKGK